MIPAGKHGEHMAELVACKRERGVAEAAVERVRWACAHLRESWDGDDRESLTIQMVTKHIEGVLDAAPTTTDEGGESDLVQGR